MRYYVNDNSQSNGDHEVHTSNCSWLKLVVSKTDLGEHASCGPAVAKAQLLYPTANGCVHCSPACHTG